MKMLDVMVGGVAGLIATLPMSAAMKGWQQLLPVSEQYALPPKLITLELAEEAGVAAELDSKELEAITLVNHLGYGAVSGALYGALSSGGRASVATGVAFGVGVWAASYLGWLPMLGMRAAATREPPGRNAMMVAAHVVFGGTLGAVVRRLSRE